MAAPASSSLDQLRRDLYELVNAQFDSPEYRKLLSVRFTPQGARVFEVQRTYFVINRRDCWAYASGGAPLDVKRLIWEHEREELIGQDGVPDHVTLSIQEAEQVGLAAGGFEGTHPTATMQTCFWAWIHLAKSRPWLEAVTASSVLEMVVSDEIVRGGGIVRRLGERMAKDLGLPLKEQATNAVHLVADMEHPNLLFKVAAAHAQSPEDHAAILRAAADSLTIERTFRGHLADLIASAAE